MKYIFSLILISFCLIQIKSDKSSDVIKYAKSKIGCGYVWGATGQTLTEEKLKWFHSRAPDHVDQSICKKWLGMQVFDCAGLVKMAFDSVGIELAAGATSIWEQTKWYLKGTINSLPAYKVCILFRKADGRMKHTGIYITNGYYIHAKGSNDGVMMEKMADSKWTHWGIPQGLYIEEPIKEVCSIYPCQAKVANAPSGRVNFRVGPDTKKDLIQKINVGETVTVLSYENNWYKITYGNKTGYMMAEFLVPA